MLSFQYLINIKMLSLRRCFTLFLFLFLGLSLQNLVCILYLTYISVQTSHILNAKPCSHLESLVLQGSQSSLFPLRSGPFKYDWLYFSFCIESLLASPEKQKRFSGPGRGNDGPSVVRRRGVEDQ